MFAFGLVLCTLSTQRMIRGDRRRYLWSLVHLPIASLAWGELLRLSKETDPTTLKQEQETLYESIHSLLQRIYHQPHAPILTAPALDRLLKQHTTTRTSASASMHHLMNEQLPQVHRHLARQQDKLCSLTGATMSRALLAELRDAFTVSRPLTPVVQQLIEQLMHIGLARTTESFYTQVALPRMQMIVLHALVLHCPAHAADTNSAVHDALANGLTQVLRAYLHNDHARRSVQMTSWMKVLQSASSSSTVVHQFLSHLIPALQEAHTLFGSSFSTTEQLAFQVWLQSVRCLLASAVVSPKIRKACSSDTSAASPAKRQRTACM